jgi:hypothetical protein
MTDQETHPGDDGTVHRGYLLDCPKCMPLRDMVSPPRSGRMAVQSPPLTCGRALSTGQPCPDHPAKPEPMSRAVADLILRQSMALLDEGIGPKSYGNVMGPDTGPQDVALILQAVDVIGQENILDRDLQDEIQSMRGDGER